MTHLATALNAFSGTLRLALNLPLPKAPPLILGEKPNPRALANVIVPNQKVEDYAIHPNLASALIGSSRNVEAMEKVIMNYIPNDTNDHSTPNNVGTTESSTRLYQEGNDRDTVLKALRKIFSEHKEY